MLRNNTKKLLTSTRLHYLNLLIIVGALAFSGYLEYVRVIPKCMFCLAVRSLLAVLAGLSLGSLLLSSRRRMVYPAQLFFNLLGLLLSLRQFYFEQTVKRFISCPKYTLHPLRNVTNWLYRGAPACQKTYLLGPLTLAGWACIIFSLLSLIVLWLYLKPVRRK